VAGELESIAYETAVRALDKQEKLLEELRARTGILLAASSLAASLLGGDAFKDFSPAVAALVALTAFAVSLGSSLFVLIPREEFVFALDGPAI
jgi:hypothetical protein